MITRPIEVIAQVVTMAECVDIIIMGVDLRVVLPNDIAIKTDSSILAEVTIEVALESEPIKVAQMLNENQIIIESGERILPFEGTVCFRGKPDIVNIIKTSANVYYCEA
ncbi:hypothetical protein [Cellulosilyticum ruminicola]|uniref:hypothetical protein n=1 Tax=Cellulosilyticum ruminicola TaxID=425254 RepID=UPI0006D21F36|nr:hypothetical protein [Cellulosilyticum ruminicola]